MLNCVKCFAGQKMLIKEKLKGLFFQEESFSNYGLYYLVWLLISLVALFSPIGSDRGILLILFFAPLLFCIIFAPAIILSCLLFQFIKNNYVRILIFAMLIPLTNLIYAIIINPIFSFEVGRYMLLAILPLLFIAILIIPQKYLSIKRYSLLTVILTEIIGILFLIMLFIVIPNIYLNVELNHHNSTINAINEYKTKNGKYPNNLLDIKTKSSGDFKVVEYKVLDNGKSFVYKIKEGNSDIAPIYIYTSDIEYKNKLLENEQRKTTPIYYNKYGKWIIEEVDD